MTLFPQPIWHCRPGDMITDRGRTPPGQNPYLPPIPQYAPSPFQQQIMQSPMPPPQRQRAYSTWQSFPVRPPCAVYFDHVEGRWVEQPGGIVFYDMKGEPATFIGQYQNNERHMWQGYGQTYQQPYYPVSTDNYQSSFSSNTYTQNVASSQYPFNSTYTDSAQSPFNPNQVDSAPYSASTIRCVPRNLESHQHPETPTKTPSSYIKQEAPMLTISPSSSNSEPISTTSPHIEPPLPGFSNVTSASTLQSAAIASPEGVFDAISSLSRDLEKTKFALATTEENFHHSRSDYASMHAMFEKLVEIGEQKLVLAYKMMERLRERDLHVIGDQELMRRAQESGVGVDIRPEMPMMKPGINTGAGMKGTGFDIGGGYQVEGPIGLFLPGVNGVGDGGLMPSVHEENSAGEETLDYRTETETVSSKKGSISPDRSVFSRGRSQRQKRSEASKSPMRSVWKGKGKKERLEDSRGRLSDKNCKGRETQGSWISSGGQMVDVEVNGMEKTCSDIGVGQSAGNDYTPSRADRPQSNDANAKGSEKEREIFNPNARTFTPIQPAAPSYGSFPTNTSSTKSTNQSQPTNFEKASYEHQQAVLAHSVLLNAITTIPARFYNICPHNLTPSFPPPTSRPSSSSNTTFPQNTTIQLCSLDKCKLQRLCPKFNSLDGDTCKTCNSYCPLAHEKPTCGGEIDGFGCIYLRKGGLFGKGPMRNLSEEDVEEKKRRHLDAFAHRFGPYSVRPQEWVARETIAGLRVAHNEGRY